MKVVLNTAKLQECVSLWLGFGHALQNNEVKENLALFI